MLVRRIARPLLASTFVVMGIDVLRKPASRTEVATPLVEGSRAMLPAPAAALVPSDPENAVRVNALVQIGGGLMLATGKFPRVASSVLAATLLPTTVAGHPFWAEQDPQQRQVQQVQFLKNISILGGLMLAAVDTEAKPSLGWRGRRAAANASAAISDALPSQSSTDSLTHSLGETAHQVGERASAFADIAGERASALADVAGDHASDLADRIAAEAPELRRRARKSAEKALKHADRAAQTAVAKAEEQGAALADAASTRGAALADRVAAEAPELRRRAHKNAKKASKRADKAAKVAVAKAEELRDNLV